MKKNIMIIAGVLLMTVVSSCNKTKVTSERFIKAGEWKVTELSVDGVNEGELPKWEIEDCDVYEESCFGEWKNEEGGHAEFIWQFSEKANTFEISHQASDEHDHEGGHAAEEAAVQAYNFSGVYEVIEKSKTEMEFESTRTSGHSGNTVKIKIEKL